MLTIVIPCFNESDGIAHLKTLLTPTLHALRKRIDLEVLFVDDGSTDDTYERLAHAFSLEPGVKIVRHPENRNLGAAIRTGLAHASGDCIAFLDSDCTYSPSLIFDMLNALEKGADVVTASPYHPNGAVLGVPKRRLILSQGLSRIYRFLLGTDLHTYTAMVRLFRKSVLEKVVSKRNDFVSVAETLIDAIRAGYAVTEVPAQLSVRQYGSSKIKIVKVIVGHLGIILRLPFRAPMA